MQPVAPPPPLAPVTAPARGRSSPPHRSRDDASSAGGPPALRPWSRIWRYLVAAGIAVVLWIAVSVDFIAVADAGAPDDVVGRVGAALLLDALLGLVALCLLPMRRRHPLLTAVLTGLLTMVSAAALGAAAVAAVSVATWRRWQWLLPVMTVWAGATLVYEVLWRPAIIGDLVTAGYAAFSGAFAIAMAAVCAATGYYIGARRELLVTLRVRAETAEREQALKAEAARDAERTRIAREMHDVLAHRISLVAMHAGALAYRTDLSREETAEAAGVIQRSAHLALTELREVLGVLRADGDARALPAGAEPPQPVLAQVAELVDGARVQVSASLSTADLPGGDLHALEDLPATTSRTAYRVVQEALTNACKHAPGSTVVVHLAGRPGGLLTIEVHNGPSPDRDRLGPDAPCSGYGLVGLAERVGLAGGVLEHTAGPDGSFTVRSWLPWENE